MRVGRNPLTGKRVTHRSKDITVAVITHLPEDTTDYHKGRLEMIGLSLASLRQRAHAPFDLYVYDNGSNPFLRHELWHAQARGLIDVVIFSENIGKPEATRRLLNMMPGNIVMIADDDLLYKDNWLLPQLEILQTYPNVGLVSGMPTHVCFGWGTKSTKEFAMRDDVTVTYPEWPYEWHEYYVRSTNNQESVLEYLEVYGILVPAMLEYSGVKAWGTGHHGQFLGYRDVLQHFANNHAYRNWYMGKLSLWLDRPVDDAGYLRLCTPDLLVRHMGNRMDEHLEKIAEGVERWW